MKNDFEIKDLKYRSFKWGHGKEVESIRTMSSQDLLRSMKKTLKGHHIDDGVWVFGYGSLMWNPDFEIEERISGEETG